MMIQSYYIRIKRTRQSYSEYFLDPGMLFPKIRSFLRLRNCAEKEKGAAAKCSSPFRVLVVYAVTWMVAALLVTLMPLSSVTMQRYCLPSRAAVSLQVIVAVLNEEFAQLPPTSLYCHW